MYLCSLYSCSRLRNNTVKKVSDIPAGDGKIGTIFSSEPLQSFYVDLMCKKKNML